MKVIRDYLLYSNTCIVLHNTSKPCSDERDKVSGML